MKILFTGASSFTGYWFVKVLKEAGHEVVCPLRGAPDRYDGVRKQRVGKLQSLCRLVPETPFGTEAFFKLICEGGTWDMLCHHATEAANYRSPDFDIQKALQNNTLNLRAVLAALKADGLKGVVLTGSVFENDEGAGEEPLRAFSGYGLSKGLTWQMFRYHCGEAHIPLGKFVIPNPFGPFEEPRFTAYLMHSWKEGKPAGVKTPDYVRDNVPVDLLAAVYAQFAGRVLESKTGTLKINPSGYIEKQGDFAQRVANEARKRLGWECQLELARQEDFSEPLRRVNTDPAAPLVLGWNESAAWDAFVEFYSPKQPQ
jgi:nucleoside-diphosphate-sugar epimerase